ncbi:MAG: NupC/NupG family nucleoside CNT transporter [Lentisphaerae bacterium]|nr:NupC/NupG family nucleoside CNT transporter [Lentisphaerota bacterium]
MERWTSLLGIGALIGLAWVFSTNRRAVNWRLVAWGLILQVVFALLILKTAPGRWIFDVLNRFAGRMLEFQFEGARFVFGPLAVPPDQPGSLGFYFAFQVLTTIVFFSSLISILYYFGVMQKLVMLFARIMVRTCRTSGAETLSAAANIFVGQTEAPLLIKPYLAKMTRSEMLCVMTGGMATIAGGVMAAYVGMLRGHYPDIAGHLLAASVMSAPAALVMSKLLMPETETPETAGRLDLPYQDPSVNVIDAAANGASTGLQLAFNVGAMLVAFLGLLALANWLVGWCGGLFGHPELRFETILGWVFHPLAWLLGTPAADCAEVGRLLGEKTVLNELVAYSHLAEAAAKDPAFISHRSFVIVSYALCGFSNFASIGIQIGGIGALAPERRPELARLGLRALAAGSLACFMTAAIAGLLV